MTDPLLQQLAAGSEAAFTEIYNRYSYRMLLVAKSILTGLYQHTQQDSEDVVSEIFTKLWEEREKVPNIREIQPYLIGAARHGALDKIRHFKVVRKKEEIIVHAMREESRVGIGDATLEVMNEYRELVLAKMGVLPLQCGKVFRLAFIEGLDNEAIAERLGISVKTVFNQKTRALAFLRAAVLGSIVWLIISKL